MTDKKWTDEDMIDLIKFRRDKCSYGFPPESTLEYYKNYLAEQSKEQRDWEILSFKANIGGFEMILDKKVELGYFGYYGVEEKDLLASSVHTIHSVKRISDGEVFTIGDEVILGGKAKGGMINLFKIDQGVCIVYWGEGWFSSLNNKEVQKVQPVQRNPELSIYDQYVIKTISRIASLDVSDLKDGEIKNLNEIPQNREKDFGINNQRHVYMFTNGEWRYCYGK